MIFVGTSGWQYRDWRGRFYPPDLPQRAWLGHYAQRFATVEINNAFYRLPERETFQRWRDATPDDLRIAVKMSRFLTHLKRLREPVEPVRRFLDRASALGPKLAVVLLQLPPTLRFDAALVEDVLTLFPAEVRIAVEPRHRSWWTDQARTVLERHQAALCWADRLGRPSGPLWRTADLGYLRMHQGRANPRPRYGRQALLSWLDRIEGEFASDCDVYVYFNNDPGGAAVLDALDFAAQASRRGLRLPRMGAVSPKQHASRTG